MNEDYLDFLASKAPRAQPSGITPGPFHEDMRRDQVIATDFALRAGRAALFLDTGLGKTFDQLAFCQQGAENVVLSPFMGIGSEGFVSLKQKRRFVGVELEPKYYRAACRNLASAEANAVSLFDAMVAAE